MKQKEQFLHTEGDAYLQRNLNKISQRQFPGKDPAALALMEILPTPQSEAAKSLRLLEIGCSSGTRLQWLSREFGIQVIGLDPSSKAVANARQQGLDVRKGTADKLPFDSNLFDIIVFGTCLCWCDLEDLFYVTAESDRVLKNPGWLIISDFYSLVPCKVPYRHVPGMFTHKMDYSKLFTWHPHYTLMTKLVRRIYSADYTDDANEWIGLAVIRKIRAYPELRGDCFQSLTGSGRPSMIG